MSTSTPPATLRGDGEPGPELGALVVPVGSRYIQAETGDLWVKTGPGDREWSLADDYAGVPKAPPLVRIVDMLRAAIHEMQGQAFPWKRNEVAGRWIEHEIAPLLESVMRPLDEYQALAARAIEEYRATVDTAMTPIAIESLGCIALGDSQMMVVRAPFNEACKPVRVVIAPEVAAVFRIDDIKIGNVSQLRAPRGVPASYFAEAPGLRTSPRLAFDTLQVAQDLVFLVTYTGSDPHGAPFSALVLANRALEITAPHSRRIPFPLSRATQIAASGSAAPAARPCTTCNGTGFYPVERLGSVPGQPRCMNCQGTGIGMT